MSMFGEINSFLDLCERVKKRFGGNKLPIVDDNPAERFLRVFEAHGIYRNQIPRYFGSRLSLIDVQDDKSLLKVLDQKMIDDVSELFAVNREWLECASSDVYRPHDFYKRPKKFLAFLDGLLSKGTDLEGFVYTSATESSAHRSDTFILLEETFSIHGNQTLTRYHICNNWDFTYGKSRAYLIACVAAAWRKSVYLHGRQVPHEFIAKYAQGQNLLGEDIRDHAPGRHWHPEDMALDPDKLIADLPSRHDKSLALETLIKIQSSDDQFKLDGMDSVLRGIPFSEKLKSVERNDK
jgi:hypothetical protein